MRSYLDMAMTFAEYIKLIDDLLLEGKTTGPKQSDEMFGYAKLNRQRMHRLEKTAELRAEVVDAAEQLERKLVWLIITEGWCGDAAQNIPIIEKIACASSNIETRYVLRDENIELIDRFLTGGARSIPKLIALDAETLEVLGTWGARPAAAQAHFDQLKASGTGKPLIMESLQRWYNADKNHSIQTEFAALIKQWESAVIGKAAA